MVNFDDERSYCVQPAFLEEKQYHIFFFGGQSTGFVVPFLEEKAS